MTNQSGAPPLVSCVIIFLNGSAFLEDAIDSVIAQSYPRWELLLVDDGSTDGSSEIARRYAEQRPDAIRYLEHAGHANRGECVSRNLGIREAAGEYLAFLDADDVLLPRAFEQGAAALSAHPAAAMACGRTERWYSWSGAPAGADRDFVCDLCVDLDRQHEAASLIPVWLRHETAVPANCSTMLRRDIAQAVGGFDEAFGDAYEDLVLITKVALEYPVVIASPCLSRYRQHPDMSSARLERTGQWHGSKPNPVRLKYLTWLEGYLQERGGTRDDVLAEVRRQLSPYRNPVGHAVVANTSRVRESVDLALSRLGRGLRGKSTGSLVADPNPVAAAQGRDQGRTTLSWTAARTDTVEVHVGAPDGPLFSRSGPAGSAATGEWVLDGTVFYLQDASDGHPHHRSNTLDILTVRVMGGRNDRATLEIPVGHVKFGDLARRTPISRDWGFDRGRPVTRYYIERFLAAHAGDIRGAVLEIGDAAYTRRFGGAAVTKSDVLNVRDGAPETTIVADLTDAPQIASDSFDCVICTHTLQLIYDVHAAVRTLHRILKPGGVLLATVPGVGPTCGSWADSTYWKFTPLSARRIAEGVFGSAHVTVAGHGNALIAVAFLHGLVVGDVSAADLEADERGYEIAITLRAAKPIDG